MNEENKNKGFLKYYRSVLDHWLWEDDRVFSRFEAWTDLLFLARFETEKKIVNDVFMLIERGQMTVTIRELCARWNWSNTKVMRFLNTLEQDGMIVRKSDKKTTLLTIVNYDTYNGADDTKTTPKRHENDTETTPIRIKKEKNSKNTTSSEAEEALSDDGLSDEDRQRTSTTDYDHFSDKSFVARRLGKLFRELTGKEAPRLRSIIDRLKDGYSEQQLEKHIRVAINDKFFREHPNKLSVENLFKNTSANLAAIESNLNRAEKKDKPVKELVFTTQQEQA